MLPYCPGPLMRLYSQHLVFMTCLKQSPLCALRRVFPSTLDRFPTATMDDDSGPLAYYCALCFFCLSSHFNIRSHSPPPAVLSDPPIPDPSYNTSQFLVHCPIHSRFARSIHFVQYSYNTRITSRRCLKHMDTSHGHAYNA
jgi:hypothetical protein